MDSILQFFSRPSLWFIAGLLLTLSEFIVPGVLICFFGVAAMLMAGLLLLWPAMPTSLLLTLYTITSLALLFGLRRYMPKTFRGHVKAAESNPDEDDVAGAAATVVEAITSTAPGKVEFRGTNWTAVADSDIPVGARVTVLRRDNLTLHVKP